MLESSAMEGATYCVTPPEIAQDDVLYHFRWREGAEAPVVHRRQAQAVFTLQGEIPLRPQLESQVGDGVRRRYPVPWVYQVGTEAQLQARDPFRGGHGTLAGVELHAHHPQVCGHRLHALDEVLQRVGHYQQVVYVGLDEAPFCLSGRAQTVPLGPEQGLQEERVQQGALGVPLPDTAQHLDELCQPVRGDDAQPGARVEEEQEVDDLRRHGEVAQVEVEGPVRGGVEDLAGVEGEDVVGPSLLELPLCHEQEGAGVGAREGPLLPVADHCVPCEHFRDTLGEGAREQLHVQLT